MIKTGAIASAVIILLMIMLSLYGYSALPEGESIATHWNIHGEADGFSPRSHMLIGLPVAAVLLSAIFAALPLIDPRKDNLRRSSGLYISAWVGAVALLCVVLAFIVLGATGDVAPDVRLIITAQAALFIVLGNFMAKSRSSWFVGIRTPWTLSSENAWVAAHRTAGWMFVITGVCSAGAAWLVDTRLGFVALIGGVAVSAVAGIVVSYIVWRSDPERSR